MAARKKAAAKRATASTKRGAKKTARRSAKTPVKKGVRTPAKKAVERSAKKAARAPGGGRADKGEGDAAHQAAIRKLPAPHRAMAEVLDAIVRREVPQARRAVKWGSPMWGVEGRGWFAAFGSFKGYAKVNFFSGAKLDPMPPEGAGKEMRSVNIASMDALDEKQLASWVRQAAAIPGWGKA